MMRPQEATLEWGKQETEVTENSSEIHLGPTKLTLDNDPISFAVLVCVTCIVMTYLFYKIKLLKKEK